MRTTIQTLAANLADQLEALANEADALGDRSNLATAKAAVALAEAQSRINEAADLLRVALQQLASETAESRGHARRRAS